MRLFQVERFEGSTWDPSCGMGRIAGAASRAGYRTYATDIVQRCTLALQWDFMVTPRDTRVDNIVTNPPFGIADAYVPLALEIAEHKVAMLMPANWVQGDKRSRWLEKTPLRRVYFITPRPSMPPGPAIMAGEQPGNGTTDYAWLVWERGYEGRPEIEYIRREA